MSDLNDSIKAGLVPLSNVLQTFSGTGNPDNPNEGDVRQIYDAVGKNIIIEKYQDGAWVAKTIPTSSVESDGFFLFNQPADNQPISRIGLFQKDDVDLSTLGKPKVIPLIKVVSEEFGDPDTVAVGTARRGIDLYASGKRDAHVHYIENETLEEYSDGTDITFTNSIENFFTLPVDSWCDTITMKLGGTLKRARTRIFDVLTGTKIYDSTNDFEWDNNISQNDDFIWPEGDKIALNAEWPFVLCCNRQYRMQRDVMDPINSYGVGSVPYLGLTLWDFKKSHLVHADLINPRLVTSATAGEDLVIKDMETIIADATGGAITLTIDPDVNCFYVGDFESTYTNLEYVDIVLGVDTVRLKIQNRDTVYKFIRFSDTIKIYENTGAYVTEGDII